MILTSSNRSESKWTESKLNEIFRKQELINMDRAAKAMVFNQLMKSDNKEYVNQLDELYKSKKASLIDECATERDNRSTIGKFLVKKTEDCSIF